MKKGCEFGMREWSFLWLTRGRRAMLDEIAALQNEKLDLLRESRRLAALLPREMAEPEEKDSRKASQEERGGELAADSAELLPAAPYSRFPRLTAIDTRMRALAPPAFDERTTLSQLAEHLRRYAAARCGIYAPRSLYGCFLGAMAASDFILLRTEKLITEKLTTETGQSPLSLPAAAAQALGESLDITSVSSAWRGACDLLGQENPLTKRYEETRFLELIYEAGWSGSPRFAALDHLTAAPAEGYLSRLLPLYAMLPGQEGPRSLQLAASQWPTDPRLLRQGALPLPPSLWLFGALCPEEPAPSERLCAAAMEFCLPPLSDKSFLVPWSEAVPLRAARLRELFAGAGEIYPLPEGMRRRYEQVERQLAEQLHCGTGASTGQLERFISVGLACGLTSREAIDGFLYHKALRRLEYADPSLLRFALPGLKASLLLIFDRRALPLSMGYLNGLSERAAKRLARTE
ncbi:MAG: hypothetical protein FWH26_01125 [Oscillospiraceae bacterium]|nr:hypothetical protein [Oscillospiraceae bacterium]